MTSYADCSFCGGEVAKKKSTMTIVAKVSSWLSTTFQRECAANAERSILSLRSSKGWTKSITTFLTVTKSPTVR